MTTFYLRIDLHDDGPMPEDGEAFYVDNSNYEGYNGLTGYVEADVQRKLNAYEIILRSYASIFPEQFPPGHELHDPDHMYWDGVSWHTRESLSKLDDYELLEAADGFVSGSETMPVEWPEDDRALTEDERTKLTEYVLDAQDELEPYQWSSDTIEWVASDLDSATCDDPRRKED